MSTPRHYPTDLTERQWQAIAPLLPTPKKVPGGAGRPPCDLRTVVDGIIYVTKTGSQGRLLPKEGGHWSAVYSYFNRWRAHGVWS